MALDAEVLQLCSWVIMYWTVLYVYISVALLRLQTYSQLNHITTCRAISRALPYT
jgi:hypothetical protein